MSNPKPAKRPKYELILILKESYQKEGRPQQFVVTSNNLEKLLKLGDRHARNWKRNPWQYMSIYKPVCFDPYKPQECLLFLNIDKRYIS